MKDTCTYDSGSMYGCRPMCDRPAVWTVTYRGGSGPALHADMCGDHVRAMEARAFPGLVHTFPHGYKLAGNVNYAHRSGAFLVTTRGGRVSGHADTWEELASELTGRYGYRLAAPRTVSLPTAAGETVTTADVAELDWSRCPA